MKKLFTAALLVAIFASSAFANPTKVGHAILRNFAVEFNNASDVKWTATSDYVKANFLFEDQRMEAFYTPTGEKIGISRGVSIDELPLKAKRAFTKKYQDYTVKQAILFEGVEENAYFIDAENETENVIVKVFDDGTASVYKKTKKQ
jgi:hypothetical protein